MGFETLLGNALGWLLKNKFAGFATKAIPIALYVWNVMYIALRAYDPTLQLPAPEGASVGSAQYWLTSDGYLMNVGWFGTLGGLFATAAQETAKQMFVHSIGKNVVVQWLAPIVASAAKGRK